MHHSTSSHNSTTTTHSTTYLFTQKTHRQTQVKQTANSSNITWFQRNNATLAALYADQTVKRNSLDSWSSLWRVIVQPLATSSSSSMNRHYQHTTYNSPNTADNIQLITTWSTLQCMNVPSDDIYKPTICDFLLTTNSKHGYISMILLTLCEVFSHIEL